MKRIVAIGTIGLCASACSLALGIDKDEYTRGSAGTGSDGGAESGGGDGGNVDAQTKDGASAEGATLVSPCTTAHLACDDFDKPGTLTSHGWSPPFVENGSTVAPDPADAVSAPNSLKVVGNPNSSASIDWPPMINVSATKDLTLAYDLYVVEPGPGVAMSGIYIKPYSVRLLVYGSGTISLDEWDDNTGRVSNARGSSINVKGRWAHVELTLHFVPKPQTGARVLLKVDGNTVVDDVASPTVASGGVGFDLGDIDHPDGIVSMRFDNVTFDAK